jgi:hypothetical protein
MDPFYLQMACLFPFRFTISLAFWLACLSRKATKQKVSKKRVTERQAVSRALQKSASSAPLTLFPGAAPSTPAVHALHGLLFPVPKLDGEIVEEGHTVRPNITHHNSDDKDHGNRTYRTSFRNYIAVRPAYPEANAGSSHNPARRNHDSHLHICRNHPSAPGRSSCHSSPNLPKPASLEGHAT